jgi:hypothetical protein
MESCRGSCSISAEFPEAAPLVIAAGNHVPARLAAHCSRALAPDPCADWTLARDAGRSRPRHLSACRPCRWFRGGCPDTAR